MEINQYDVIVIGGGQSALACAYYLTRTSLEYLLIDKNEKPGGSWQFYWDSLQLFSPAQWSSLPGMMMEGGENEYPTKNQVIDYLKSYENKYDFPVVRGQKVVELAKESDFFTLKTEDGNTFKSKNIIDATGAVARPFIPEMKGLDHFAGNVKHSINYKNPLEFRGMNVLIVGEGNSGAQILAEVSEVANTYWATSKSPEFLADHIDGRYLFDQATQMYEAKKRGEDYIPPSLGDIVMVSSVKDARDRNVLESVGQIQSFHENSVIFENGNEVMIDAVIFCTGFRSDFSHLKHIIDVSNRKLHVKENESVECPGLFFVGHGNWTGFASATLIGVGRTAKKVINKIIENSLLK